MIDLLNFRLWRDHLESIYTGDCAILCVSKGGYLKIEKNNLVQLVLQTFVVNMKAIYGISSFPVYWHKSCMSLQGWHSLLKHQWLCHVIAQECCTQIKNIWFYKLYFRLLRDHIGGIYKGNCSILCVTNGGNIDLQNDVKKLVKLVMPTFLVNTKAISGI